MKTLVRTLILLALIVWLGAETFFPVVAATTFQHLIPDTHAAGSIVGSLLRTLHWIGLTTGALLLVLFAVAPALNVYRSRSVLAPLVLLVLMLGLTSYTQFGIIPTMERDRIAAGGAVDLAPEDNPARIDFNRLHRLSETVEEAVILLGLVLVVLTARAETTSPAS